MGNHISFGLNQRSPEIDLSIPFVRFKGDVNGNTCICECIQTQERVILIN